MPFDLTNVLATFQAYVNETLIELFNIIYIAFLNDILWWARMDLAMRWNARSWREKKA
jgi:hypothetical protein